MTSWHELDEHLALDVSDGYWSDEGIVRAMALAADVPSEGWADLAAHWPDRPEPWQVRCADLLSDVNPAHAVAILGAMMGSTTDQVALQAADSLRVILEANPAVVPESAVLGRAESLARRAWGLRARSLEQLIGHLRSRI